FSLGLFRVESETGGPLAARVEVRGTPGGTGPSTVAATLRPGRVRLLAGTARIYGATSNDDFGFRSDGPWAATVEIGTALTLAAGGITLAEIASTAMVSPVRFDGVGTTSGSVTADLRGGVSLVVFPGRTYAQTLTLGGSGGRVVVRSDGTFEVTGALGRVVELAGLGSLPVARFENGATFRLTETELTLVGRMAGGVLETAGGSGFGGEGTVVVRRDGTATATAAGALSVPALVVGRFAVEGAAGGPIAGSLTPTGLSFGGARMRFDGLVTNTLPAFAMDRQGQFLVDVGPVTSGLGPFAFGSVRYQLVRTNGTMAVTNYVGRWEAPGLGSSVEVRGYFTADGRIALSNSVSGVSIAGFAAGPAEFALNRRSETWVSTLTEQSPRAWWSLNESSGTSAANRVAAGAPGTYTGVVRADGKDVAVTYAGNGSVRFDGGYVEAAKGTDLGDLSGGFSIAAWIKVGAFDRAWNTIASQGDSSWRLQRDGTRSALGFDTDGVAPPYLAGRRAVDDGRWHHVVAVYDGRIKALWIDGELDAWTPATGAIASNAFPILIGENAQTKGRRWNGWMDEVALFDKALTPDQIVAQYAAGGGLVFRGSARLTVGGLSVDVRGTTGPEGGVGFQGTVASASLGAYATQETTLRLLRAPSGSASAVLDANLAVPGVPSARLAGVVSSTGSFDLRGAVPSGQFGGLGLSDLAFRLSGTPPAVGLSMDGKLSVSGLGTLALAGSVAANGDLVATNLLGGVGDFFGFPVRGWEQVLRRQPSNYRVVIGGDPLVTADRGSDPLAYWRLDETAGTVAADGKKTSAVRPALHGTYTGGVTLGQAAGLVGPANGRTAIRLDGVDDHVVIGDEGSFDFTGPMTVSAWVRVAAWTREWQAIVTKGDSSWRLSRYGNTRRLSFDTTSAAGAHSLPGTFAVDDGGWHHVVAVYDGRAKFLYVDGSLDGFALYGETLNRNNAPVMLGENAEARGRYFSGWL
ncbi:MAG: LamG domain-containing protein, partial [Verrucomicrobiales bacterium]|nr:LamG domain-containing protein [Verrucomicrobiales bacterium]